MTTSIVLPWRLDGNSSNVDASSYASASQAGVSGHFGLSVIANYKATTSNIPTASGTNGLNGTWTRINTIEANQDVSHFARVAAFWSSFSSGVAGVLTHDFGGDTQLASVWQIWDLPLIDTSTPIVQSKVVSAIDSAVSLTVTLDSALSDPNNIVIGIFAQQAAAQPVANQIANAAYGPAARGSSNTFASDGIGLQVIVCNAQSFTMNTLTGSVAKLGMLIELKNTVRGSSGIITPVGRGSLIGL